MPQVLRYFLSFAKPGRDYSYINDTFDPANIRRKIREIHELLNEEKPSTKEHGDILALTIFQGFITGLLILIALQNKRFIICPK